MPGLDGDPAATPEPPRGRRGRRGRRTALLASAVVLVAAVAVVGALGLGGGSGKVGAGAPARTGSFVPVTRITLTERASVDGQLGYGAGIPLPVKATGTVTWLPEQGATIGRGGTLLRVDDRPVVLMYGQLPTYRALGQRTSTPSGGTGGTSAELKGMDVLQFETNLAALGYTGFTVDERFSAATAQAVKRWQHDLGLPETGTVGIGDVVYSTGRVRIGQTGVRLGAAVTENAVSYTGTARKVVVDASARDAAWAVRGAALTIHLPDGSTVNGKVASVGRQASAAEGGGSGGEGGGGGESGSGGAAAATLPVTVSIKDQKALGGLDSGPVTVDHIGKERKNVLTVPVAALVALAEGGYGVESRSGQFVAVKTGLFADGRVEVSGSAVSEGMKVRIPE
ncbi:peptidoglycan-binding protein [Streptomyces beijiangensis]